MIKAVACSIPIYTMQCLKVPKKVCEEVNAKMASFWWGQKDEEKKIHWASWLKLTKSKGCGGMGLKDLNIMNVALLAKQCWRMLMYPDDWWVKIMKGIYYPRCSILEARKGSRAS